MYDTVNVLFLDQCRDCFKVAYIHLHEPVVRSVLDVAEVGKVAGVCEFVNIDDAVVGVFVDKEPYNVAADEAGATGYEYVSFHFNRDKRY